MVIFCKNFPVKQCFFGLSHVLNPLAHAGAKWDTWTPLMCVCWVFVCICVCLSMWVCVGDFLWSNRAFPIYEHSKTFTSVNCSICQLWWMCQDMDMSDICTYIHQFWLGMVTKKCLNSNVLGEMIFLKIIKSQDVDSGLPMFYFSFDGLIGFNSMVSMSVMFFSFKFLFSN